MEDESNNALQAPGQAAGVLPAAVAPPPATAGPVQPARVMAAPQPPLGQPAMRHRSLVRRQEAVMGVLVGVGQLLVWRRLATSAPGLSLEGHAQQGVQVALNASFILQAVCLPDTWWLCSRVPIIAAWRIATALLPCQRDAQGGMAPLLLHRDATPGWGGGFADWLRLVAGMRVLPHAMVAALLPQPLLAVLVQQAVITLLLSHPVEYCTVPLLRDAASQLRISRAVRILDAVPSPLAIHLAGLAGSANDDARACVALLLWQQIALGVVAPLLFQALTHRGHPPPPPPGAAQPTPRRAGWRRALSALQRLWRSADAALTELCTGVGVDGPQLALAAWLVLANVWLVCSAAAMRAFPASCPT